MKTQNILPLFAATALLLAPRAAVAGGEGVAAIGGFIGGMIVGSQVGSTHTHTTETVVIERTTVPGELPPAPEDAAVENVPTPPPPQTVTTTTETVVTRGGSGGYWEERPVQTWVPARWITTYDRYGFPVRRYEPGHYVTHVERVWVSGGVIHSSAPVVVQPTIVTPAPYYYSSYPAVHIGIGYTHYSGYRHYPRHYAPPYYHHRPSHHHYRNHVPSHKASHVKQHLNSHSSGKGLKPKFH